MSDADLVRRGTLAKAPGLDRLTGHLPGTGGFVNGLPGTGGLTNGTPGTGAGPLSTGGSSLNFARRGVKANVNAETKAVLELCADVVANINVKFNLVAEVKLEAAFNAKAVLDIDARIMTTLDLAANAHDNAVVEVDTKVPAKVNVLVDLKVKALVAAVELQACTDASVDVKAKLNSNILDIIKLAAKFNLNIRAVFKRPP
ncbi:hypothetical protein BGZ96_012685 [Linnemannia gamsii]|uniref:Uncharacterized protein n=1 Tax=Linnemannia gamsii TaxID=64522 RepID=A0ABQ7KBM2_9FUNG|nr:hypothetical protein BGZ96_012685 [Linnemannia gamsii]